MISMNVGVDVGIAVTAGTLTAVIRRAGGGTEAVLVDGWPTQTIDTRDDERLFAAVKKVHDVVWSDVNRVVVTHPASFSSERVQRLRQVAEQAGWPRTRMVSAPVAVAIAHAIADPTAAIGAVADITAPRGEASTLVPQPNAVWGVVASRIRGHETQTVVEMVRAAATAADIVSADVERIVVIGQPPAVHDATRQLSHAGMRGAVAMSPVTLAGDGLIADEVIRGNHHQHPAAARARGSWPRPVSSLACLIGSLAAVAAVMSGAGPIGAQPDTVTFGLASLGLFTAAMGAASFTASRLVTRQSGWGRAGRSIMVGAGVGAAAVAAAIVVVSAHFAVPAWPLLLAGGLAVAPSAVACGLIGTGLTARPDVPPIRNLWPPVGAMTAVTIAAAFVHGSALDPFTGSGWDLLPIRVGVGVWLFAVTGLVIASPWPRVVAGLAIGTAAGLVAGPGTVPVFAIVVIAVVSGWWLIKASLVHFDRHGLPDVKPPAWTRGVPSPTRTVH